MKEKPKAFLDEKKYKGLKNEFLVKSINFSDDNRIGNNRGERTRHITYPTFVSYDIGENSENRDNSNECINMLRRLIRSDAAKDEITLSKWQQHSINNDEYVLIRKQTIADGVIYTQQTGGDVTHFVLQSLENNPIQDVTQTEDQRQKETSASNAEEIVPSNT